MEERRSRYYEEKQFSPFLINKKQRNSKNSFHQIIYSNNSVNQVGSGRKKFTFFYRFHFRSGGESGTAHFWRRETSTAVIGAPRRVGSSFYGPSPGTPEKNTGQRKLNGRLHDGNRSFFCPFLPVTRSGSFARRPLSGDK